MLILPPTVPSTGVLLPTFIVAVSTILYLRRVRLRQEDLFWGSRRKCKPIKQLEAGIWPLGIGILNIAFKRARAQRILRFFVEVVENTGYTFEQRLLGSVSVGTVEPKNIEAILTTQFADFGLGERRQTFFPLLGDGIFTQDGTAWKHSRDLLRPLFLMNRHQNFDEISKHVETLIAAIPPAKPIDLQSLFFRFTLDTSTFLLFGRSIHSMSGNGQGDERKFAEAFETAQDFLARRGRLGGLYWLIGGKRFRAACSEVHTFIERIVRDALDQDKSMTSQPTSNYVFLDALIRETQDVAVIRDQLLNVLLAGRDTSACLLSWTFRLLARNQCVLHRLRNEVSSIVGIGSDARAPERVDLKKLRYLDLVIKEVLRLYPSVPVNSRTAMKRTTLPTGGGSDGTSPILLRKGEAVGYCVYAMHRRKDLYGEDAEMFRPERWEEDDGKLGKTIGYGYLPFNGGPRICLGQEFALLEVGYAIVRLLQRFPYVSLPASEYPIIPAGEEKQIVTLVLASADGCWVEMRTDAAGSEF